MVVPRRNPIEKPDHYSALKIPESANVAEIKSAYRRLARECHPDKNQKEGAAEEFKKLTLSYEVLSSPRKRTEYDLSRGVWRRESNTAKRAGTTLSRESTVSFNRSVSRDAHEELIQARNKRAEDLNKRRAISKQFSCVGGRMTDAQKFYFGQKKPPQQSVPVTRPKAHPPASQTPSTKVKNAQKKAAARVRSTSVSPSTLRNSPAKSSQWRTFSNMSLPPSYI
eukprot:TRINITY_DN17279_c0_g1_i1.p1 TRINITY_DN17279_c0_g1~~TRINITY_DN17279_c0_g1_i1.p1  ORF type:complete len:259 (+),score=20.41 TRINITY_DN17279_c0_g1_i1:107-778(+)